MSFISSVASRRNPLVCRSCSLRFFQRGARHASTAPKPLNLPDGPARTRFAPSPTGYLHLGSLRTALFNYLLAKRTGGQFLLRIEDTDQKRTVADAEKRLLDDLRWAGLQWDEGPEIEGPYGPYKQSQRTQLYREAADKLLQSGHAYRCFCTPERLGELTKQRAALGLPTDYDRTCAHIPKELSEERAHNGEQHVVRLRAPGRYPAFKDLVYGSVGKGMRLLAVAPDGFAEDPILLKSDGLPTYHLANVVDDHHMKITHVIRGTEWLPSTPKHLAMYQAFGWEPPKFAHVGLLVDKDGNKLSKRNMDIDVSSYRKAGYLPEALTNFVALLGWSHRAKSDVFSLEELAEQFTLKFTKGNTIVTDEKLKFLQHQHQLRRLVPGDPSFEEAIDKLVALQGIDNHPECSDEILQGRSLRDYMAAVLTIDAKNYDNPSQFLTSHDYFFTTAGPSNTIAPDQKQLYEAAWQHFFAIAPADWTEGPVRDASNTAIADVVEARAKLEPESERKAVEKQVKKEAFQHFRAALADGMHGPGVVDIMLVLGRDVTLKRLRGYLG